MLIRGQKRLGYELDVTLKVESLSGEQKGTIYVEELADSSDDCNEFIFKYLESSLKEDLKEIV